MEILENISEDEMIAIFLKAEINSSRFSKFILDILRNDGKERDIVTNPNTNSREDNEYRRSILERYRGFSSKTLLFNGFPSNVGWKRVSLSKDELKDIKFIKENYWIALSNNSRLVPDAVKNIRKGIEVFGKSNEVFFETAKALEKGEKLPPMILVTTGEKLPLVALEGNLRLGAYHLKPENIPGQLEAIVGYSPQLIEWVFY